MVFLAVNLLGDFFMFKTTDKYSVLPWDHLMLFETAS
jgi:hypothetical protein